MARRYAILCGVLGLLIGAALTGAAPVSIPVALQKQTVEAGSSLTYTGTFKAGERASVIASGNGRTALGLYVYDQHGNCVAHDDMGTIKTMDDLGAEWYPPRTASYTIEVCNFGALPNIFQIALRSAAAKKQEPAE